MEEDIIIVIILYNLLSSQKVPLYPELQSQEPVPLIPLLQMPFTHWQAVTKTNTKVLYDISLYQSLPIIQLLKTTADY